MRIGILALQGAFAEHGHVLDKLGVEHFEIRQQKDLERPFDGLILPGGESTVMGKLLEESGMLERIRKRIEDGMPVFGTCAGLILLAEQISNDENVYFGTLPVTVERNAYGRQLGSFQKKASFKDIGDFDMTFIRAPYIKDAKNTTVLATIDGRTVAVQYKNQIGLAFHPELGNDTRIHEKFLQLIQN